MYDEIEKTLKQKEEIIFKHYYVQINPSDRIGTITKINIFSN
jgi:hypothetical protein